MDKHYLISVPIQATLAAAGCKHWNENLYWSERFNIEVPETLVATLTAVLFPFLAGLSEVQVRFLSKLCE